MVIVSADTWDREREHRTGKSLVEALAVSHMGDLDLERPLFDGFVRAIDR